MRRSLILLATVAVLAGPLIAWTSTAGAQEPATSTVATGLHVPWGIAFLPDGSALVSERTTGRILRIGADGTKRVAMRVPRVATNAGEGGLLGLALSPRYAQDGLVYAYLTTRRDNRLVRFRLGGRVRPIVTGIRRGVIHDGGRSHSVRTASSTPASARPATAAWLRTAARRTARSCA
jgi:glucose/arabinose dehydrogenase